MAIKDRGLLAVLNFYGSARKVARACGLAPSSVAKWRRVPACWADALAANMGVTTKAIAPHVADHAAPKPQSAADWRISRAVRAVRAAVDVVKKDTGRAKADLLRLRTQERQLAMYLAITAVDDVCRQTVADFFAVSHQAVSKAAATWGDKRGDDDALDAHLAALEAEIAQAVGP